MVSRYLKLLQISQFVEGNLNSRNMTEGEQVLKAGQVVLVGSKSKRAHKIGIISLVLQTSALTSFPHEVEGSLELSSNSNNVNIEQMDCSCKAGQSGTCKHVVATLLYLERNNILDLEDLSCTDLKCTWSSQKNTVDNHFSPVPANEFCCAKDEDKNKKLPFEYRNLDENLTSTILKNLCEAAPNSAITLHLAGGGTSFLYNNIQERYEQESIKEIIKNSLINNEAIKEINFNVSILPCCLKVLESLKITDPVDICYSTAVNRKLCSEERKLRISGSRIYDLYTYTKNRKANWQCKSQKFFWPLSVMNKFIKHGLLFEDAAIERYSELYEKTVIQCGFVVNSRYQWLGYTPDGVIFENGRPEKLLEIKCCYKGKDATINDCLQEITYLDKKTGFLKTKHKYYGQIQLGMLILNLNSCDFVVYTSFDKSMF